MQALHGGTAKNDPRDAPKIAALRRGGLLPQASVSPAQRRATRALLRRRTHLRRKRAELLAHGQHTQRHSNVPEIGKQIAYHAPRAGGAARWAAPAVPPPLAVARALLTSDAQRLSARELSIPQTAPHHEAPPCLWCQPGPGAARASAAGCSTTSTPWTASPGDRLVAPLGAWARGPRNRRATAWALPAQPSGTPPSRGPVPQPPPWAFGTIPRARGVWPEGRNRRRKAQRCPSWLRHWPGRSLLCASAKPPVLWTAASVPQGAEPVRRAAHWTPRGCA
jgi:hypothetical protein